ncbi:hypothetical protein KEJ50_06305 [Candidatus Bathyarchaeota archaeon]|nr:hypothetical protein [Candidatus Bathyarchaeota archaeon]
MELITASAIVSYVTKLEEESAKLYEELAQKYSEAKTIFLSLAKENKMNKQSIERTYYGIISDKLEACFIKILNTDDYSIEIKIPKEVSYLNALQKTIEIEEKIQKFFVDASDAIGSLVPDVSWSLSRIGKKREDRILKLKSLLEKIK